MSRGCIVSASVVVFTSRRRAGRRDGYTATDVKCGQSGNWNRYRATHPLVDSSRAHRLCIYIYGQYYYILTRARYHPLGEFTATTAAVCIYRCLSAGGASVLFCAAQRKHNFLNNRFGTGIARGGYQKHFGSTAGTNNALSYYSIEIVIIIMYIFNFKSTRLALHAGNTRFLWS